MSTDGTLRPHGTPHPLVAGGPAAGRDRRRPRASHPDAARSPAAPAGAEASARRTLGRSTTQARAVTRLGGDDHGDGVPVRVDFDDASWVWKPRGSWAEGVLQQALALVAAELDREWPRFAVLEDGSSSWQALVEQTTLSRRADLEEHFYRCGVLLAVSHALRVTDLNHENIIATDGGPQVVDAEMICRPSLRAWVRESDLGTFERFDASIDATLMLPLTADPGDPAGLGRAGGSRDQDGTFTASAHLPLGPHGPVDPRPWAAFVSGGLGHALAQVGRLREDLLALLEADPSRSCRVALRPTAYYAAPLAWVRAQSGAPRDVIRAGLTSRLGNDAAATAVLGLARPADDAAVHALCVAESDFLADGVVPRFTVELGGASLLGRGGEVVGELGSTPLDAVRAQLSVVADEPRHAWTAHVLRRVAQAG